MGSRPKSAIPGAPGLPPTVPVASELLRQRTYRELVRRHFDRLRDKLFADFTGIHFHICWAPAPSRGWDEEALPQACSVCCQLSGSPLLKDCRVCGPRQLARALSGDGGGHCFTCRLGVRNYWLPIRIRDETLGIAYLQALDHAIVRRPARVVRHPLPPMDARVMDGTEFTRAGRLLRLIVHDVQTASLADLQKADLAQAHQALLAYEKSQGRWRSKLSRVIAGFDPTPPRLGLGGHADQIVDRLLEHIDQHSAQPITLKECAGALGLNAAYLSALFSRALGIAFKTYLTELRVERARHLLSNSTQKISQIATAVGYASEKRFGLAFKNVTGLSPRMWRETLRMPPRG